MDMIKRIFLRETFASYWPEIITTEQYLWLQLADSGFLMKQEVFNLVQALKTLFLYTQGEKDTAEEFGRSFRSLWEMVEAFGGSPGVHKGLVDELLSNTT